MTNLNVVQIKPQKIAADFAKILRELADKADSGQMDSCVVMALVDGEYESILPSSLTDSLVLADLLHYRVLRKFCCD